MCKCVYVRFTVCACAFVRTCVLTTVDCKTMSIGVTGVCVYH